jgi:hypothetical protein
VNFAKFTWQRLPDDKLIAQYPSRTDIFFIRQGRFPMGRHSKADLQRIGPRLWARFLKHHFGCSELAPLNAQLLLPIAPFEVFKFGESPEPLPERLAPKIFNRAYDLGRSPDGAYTPEIYDAGSKFNLYERVTARVPESRYWLLKELDPYLYGGPPPIDTTVRMLSDILADMKLTLLESNVISAWEQIDTAGPLNAEKDLLDALSRSPLPECKALSLAVCHLSVWWEPPLTRDALSYRLLRAFPWHVDGFLFALLSSGFDISGGITSSVITAISSAFDAIGRYGTRSMNADKGSNPPCVAKRLVLVPDTPATRQAILYLAKYSEFRGVRHTLWSGYSPEIPLSEFLCSRSETKPLATDQEAGKSTDLLKESAASVPAQLAARAAQNLARYEHLEYTERTGRRGKRLTRG